MSGISRCPPVHTFDYQYKGLSKTLSGEKEAGCQVNPCGFFTCLHRSVSLGFSALCWEQITQAGWDQYYAWCSKAQPGLLAFPWPLSQKRKARPFSAFSVDRDKEEGVGRWYSQNGEQGGLANRSGNVGTGHSLFSGEVGRDQITESRYKVNGSWWTVRLVLFGLILFGLHHGLNLNKLSIYKH